jgi:hypothetical protein
MGSKGVVERCSISTEEAVLCGNSARCGVAALIFVWDVDMEFNV